MIHKTKKAIKKMVAKHKHTYHQHKDMMWVHLFLALIVWVFLHMLFPPVHTESKEPTHDETIAMIEHYAPTIVGENNKAPIDLFDMLHNPNDKQREIPATITAPSLSLKITPDKQEWFMMHIDTEHFAFTPEHLWKKSLHDYYEGHGTLYINDQYVWRVYSEYYHIPEHFLQSWNNIILVTLNDNNHKTFSRQGQVIYNADSIHID